MSKLYIRESEYFRPATQAEIDAAARVQLWQDAAVGKVLREFIECQTREIPLLSINITRKGPALTSRNELVDMINFAAFVHTSPEWYVSASASKLGKGATLYAALVAAGLIKKETNNA